MEITVRGEKVQLVGEPLKIGDELPHFKLFNQAGEKVKTVDLIGKPMVVSVVPDLHTDVCSLETKKFNQQADEFPDVPFLTISTNTPADQTDWCAAEGVKNLTLLSDHEESFGYATNLLIPDLDLLARCVYVVDGNGKIVYRDLLRELTDEPDYDKVLAQLAQFAK
ncbi:thiol peroxidase [Furfurilactobacillus siliginis]|uniref:2-Cys peroxiredoxin n=1 Tax=Furfurilactobacillus siliginis TaxID=348151 RepID=A0A0R2L6D3_9LACO|nr:thiol peroxidase [Furfurilactobacillus siliginis]KRN95477.1 redoxin domain-containing protein [Furfurilactobacillus siliginis]GEK28250.1 2-Cys peroxiredoxin [Furfurilactobacillus siliginis]